MKELSKEAREAKNAYQRQYAQRNKKRIKEYQQNYWERKARGLSGNQEAELPIAAVPTDKTTTAASAGREEVLALREQGLSIRQIAGRLNLSKSKVERLLPQVGHETTGRDSKTK